MAALEIIGGPRGLAVRWGAPANIQSEQAKRTGDDRPGSTHIRRVSARCCTPAPADMRPRTAPRLAAALLGALPLLSACASASPANPAPSAATSSEIGRASCRERV